MKRIKWLIICLAACIPGLLSAGLKPNIIYILADDLGYGDVGFNGQKLIQTPSLDELASSGLVFDHHYAGAAVCGPSRCALMTGKSQAVGFIKNNPGGSWERENLPRDEITVAEKLKDAGYTTACIGKWGLGPHGKSGYPLNQGFDEFFGYDVHVAAHNYYPKVLWDNDKKMHLKGNVDRSNPVYSHDLFTKRTLEYVKRKHDNPFFLYLSYTIPHDPYNPPDLGEYGDRPWSNLQKKYASMVSRMDHDIGKLIDTLEERGIYENTLVIFSSDNGTSMPDVKSGMLPGDGNDIFKSSSPFRGRKRDMYEGGIRAATVFSWPGKIQPGRTSHISAFQDVMPTLCELVGVSAPAGIDGISLLPTLAGNPEKQEQHDYLYWEFCFMAKGKGSRGIQAVLDVENQIKGIRKTRTGKIRLYDLKVDTTESQDIADQYPEKAAELNARMDSMRSKSSLWPLSFFD